MNFVFLKNPNSLTFSKKILNSLAERVKEKLIVGELKKASTYRRLPGLGYYSIERNCKRNELFAPLL